MDNQKSKKNLLKLLKIILTFVFILSNTSNIFSQQDKYHFDKLRTSKEDFPKLIRAMVKDKKGFVWFGTDVGLYRFDGYNFKSYFYDNKNNSISSNKIVCLCDDGNYLWIGTFGEGLNRLDKTTGQFKVYRFDPNNKSSIDNDKIMELYISDNSELWIGTWYGLNKFDKKTENFTRYNNNTDDTDKNNHFIVAICEDSKNDLWVGTLGGGVDKYEPGNNKFIHYKFDPKDSNSLSSDWISSIIADKKDNIWIATADGVNKYDKEKEKFFRYTHDSLNSNSLIENSISSIILDNEQNIWFGGNKDISILDPDKNSFMNFKKIDYPAILDDMSLLYADDMGLVWISKFKDGGFAFYNTCKWRFDINNFGGVGMVTFGEDDNENIWVGSYNGIDIIDKRKKLIRQIKHYENDSSSLRTDRIFCIYRDKKNFMWVGTFEAPLEKYEPETGKFIHFYDFDGKGFSIFSILEDNKENLWIGLMEGGIRVFDKDRILRKKYLNNENDSGDHSQLEVYQIFQDSKENIWFATSLGFSLYEQDKDSIIFINDEFINRVFCINEDNNGFLWLGTNEGLNKFNPDDKSFTPCIVGGEPGYQPNGILKDKKGNFWMQSVMNITMFNPNDQTSINYKIEDGVPYIMWYINSYFKSKDGEMYFGGSPGFIGFYPDSIYKNENIPNVVLTDFKIFNKEVKLDTSITEIKEITISHKENFFSFDYAALDYTNPVKNQYAYMLEGIDNDWNDVGNVMTANYTNVEPGEYIFRVKGSNNDGVWNEEGASVKLSITPPWYMTFWFKGFVALSLVGGIGFIFMQRVKKIKKEKKQQEEFTKKLIESQETDRKRIAAELHDSLGQDLVIIKNKALISIKKDDDSKLKEQMKEISELTSSAINEVREISYNLRPYELDRLGLLKTLQSLVDRADKSTNINFHCDIDNIDKVFAPEVEINIYRIIQECLTNIIKHSEATEVIVRLKKLEKKISIFISDNGKGFDVEKNFSDSERKGFGLRGIPERVKLFGGDFKIESEPGTGTRIKIVIPIQSLR
ncbi:MAG: histidine kinase [Bacteroidota bacterium]|nr:histidine kinase [Bacteroidota bacterium]